MATRMKKRLPRRMLTPHGPQYLLLPRHGIRLTAFDGDGPRFARLFRETWRQIPLWARRCMLKHWRGMRLPNIELMHTYSGDERALATAGLCGLQLRFRSQPMGELPEEAVMRVIAHELAHVVQWSKGWIASSGNPDLIEEHADDLADGWGFDSDSLEAWCEQRRACDQKAGAA